MVMNNYIHELVTHYFDFTFQYQKAYKLNRSVIVTCGIPNLNSKTQTISFIT